MKKVLCIMAALCCVASLAIAQEAAQTAAMTLKGDIIDNMCAGSQQPEAIGDFVKTHTKECALMPACAASGYSIYADGKLMKFDKDSNAKVEAFLKQDGSKLQVVVEAKEVGGEISLVSIKNQE